ncbi:MBL fold metallo-hydrolase [Variovorax sp. ZS18.2.2]|uniref:MBL fold metallo-hydrolase n=1 Tax=Variovorax sp. ZS18.2.2 TaxID=2971255 RepID=UPI002150E641|nr:MBL fold metallo-hydrolase [Variovorax sp. ZS18.2.2]MCR6480861.1 MBL fold metallo-hydrolase [Variovorax sp. ZS18.2.2]
MYNFKVDRTQYPIGQGGFHHTQIHCWHEEPGFSVVYDCGGSNETHRKDVIAAFADERPREHDWLVISHLDLDHISGVPQLHASKQTFANVILPHLKAKERQKYFDWMVFVALAQGRDADVIQEGITTAIGLYKGTFGRPVMIIHGPTDGPGDEQQQAPALSLPATVREVLRTAKEGTTLGDGTSFTLAKVDWQFRFYSREWDSAKASVIWNLTVLNALKLLIKNLGKGGSTGIKSWKGEVNKLLNTSVSEADCDAALEQVRTGEKAKRGMTLKALIGALYKLTELEHYNSASLCMYSGPRERGNDYGRFSFARQVHGLPDWETPRLQPVQMTRSVGWLGTGDMHFPDQAVVTDFASHFLAELPRVSTILVPHHGSRHNYATDGISPLLSLMTCFSLGVRLFIAPAKRSVYGHPHEEVESALSRCDVLQVVSESALTQVDESITNVWR